jgi:hypothetical protein
MRFHPVLAAALFALVAAAPAAALPPRDFCDNNPDSPLCNPEEPPIDPCDVNPELCEPPDPCVVDPASCEPPDPCELDPASCEPPDPCEVDPASCEPVDPCELDPASCEPEPEPEPNAIAGTLTGSARVKGRGFKEAVAVELFVAIEGTAFTILNDPCDVYRGQLAPKGKKGEKFKLFLDEPSGDVYEQFVAREAAAARGAGMGAPLGESSRIVLKRGDDGSASLKLKSELLFESGEVVFKARLNGVLTEQLIALPAGPLCL